VFVNNKRHICNTRVARGAPCPSLSPRDQITQINNTTQLQPIDKRNIKKKLYLIFFHSHGKLIDLHKAT